MEMDRSDWPNCVNLGLLPPDLCLHPRVGNVEMLNKMLNMQVDIAIARTNIQL